MSVTCPFTRRCENEVYEKRTDSPLKKLVQYTPEDYKILDTLDDIPLKNQLVELKKRLLKVLSKRSKGEVDINVQIRTHLEKGDVEGAIKLA